MTEEETLKRIKFLKLQALEILRGEQLEVQGMIDRLEAGVRDLDREIESMEVNDGFQEVQA